MSLSYDPDTGEVLTTSVAGDNGRALVTTPDPIELSPVGLTVHGELSYEDWHDFGQSLQRVEGAIQWWVGDWLNYGEYAFGEKYTQAIEETEWGYDTLKQYAWVASKVELCTRVHNLSFFHHREVAGRDPDEQRYWLDCAEQGDEEGIWPVAKLRREMRKADREKERLQAGKLPDGIYNIIYTDPPWRYEHVKTANRAIENHYPTMPLEDICALPVSDIADDDCVLFLWATSPKLAEAIQVVEAWGFNYRTCMVWVKDKIGMGYYARQRHELLLIATKGEPMTPDESERPDSVIMAPRQEHSAKPEIVYEVIERMYPHAAKVELFARQARDGWSGWGNEYNAGSA